MKVTDCAKCTNTGLPLNETLKIDGEIYCKACIEANFTNRNQLKGKIVEKMLDPTVCATCGKDYGDLMLPQIAKYPTCEECAVAIKNKILPFWVKIFFAAVVAIVLFSFFWNLRFFIAYRDLHTALTSFSNGDFKGANKFMKTASDKVPEVGELKTASTFFNGVSLLVDDKSADALNEFTACKEKLPPGFKIDAYINQAKMGIGFDTKNYDLFLSASKDNLGLDSDRAFAGKYIQKARSLDSTGNDLKVWANMIEYRMETREIIRKEDFIKKYPNGWSKN
jgi:hypothetical protein